MSSGSARRSAPAVACVVAMAAVAVGSVADAPSASATGCNARGSAYHSIPWAVTRMRAVAAGRLADGGAGVKVAVVDSGVNPVQSQVADLAAPALVAGMPNALDCGQPPKPSGGSNGHGTAVAALIAATERSGNGFTGLAPKARIIPVKWIDGTSSQSSDSTVLAHAIDLALSKQAQVINLSVDVPNPSAALEAAVLRAMKQHVIVVASAGNGAQSGSSGGAGGSYPARYATDPKRFPTLLSVAATDEHDQPMQGAAYGDFVNIAAPGVDMEMPSAYQGFFEESGTSFAAPLVAATAALVMRAHPGLTPEQVVRRIELTADPDFPADHYGAGIVNPVAAITTVLDDQHTATVGTTTRPVPPMHFDPPPSTTLRTISYAAAAGLLALAVAFVVGVAAWRRTAEHHRNL